MRTAILISGYLRYFEECFPYFFHNLYLPLKEHLEVDIFCHTWKNIPEEYFGLHKFKEEHGVDVSHPELNIGRFIELYKPTSIVVEDFFETKDKLRLSNFCNVEDIKDELYSPKLWRDGILHTTGQYYKIYQTNNLKIQHEKQNGFIYDLVIKTRSDCCLPNPINISNIFKDHLYVADYGDDSKMVADSFYAGDSQILNYICNIYEEFPYFYSKAKELKHGFAVEKMLYLYLKNKYPMIRVNGSIINSKLAFFVKNRNNEISFR